METDAPGTPPTPERARASVSVLGLAVRVAITIVPAYFVLLWHSIEVAITFVALWGLVDPALPHPARLTIAVFAVPWLLCAGCVVAVGGDFIDYRLGRGTIYVADLEPIRGVSFEYAGAPNRGYERDLLPGLDVGYSEGPYGVEIVLWDPGLTPRRAKLEDASISAPGGARIRLDMRREVRCYEESRVFEDGWIPFQTHWPDSGGTMHPIPPEGGARCVLMHMGMADLDALGPDLVFTATLQLDKDGLVTSHELRVRLRRETWAWSGITVHSP